MSQHLRPESLQQGNSGFAAWEKLYQRRWRRSAILQNIEDSFVLLFLVAFWGTIAYWVASTVMRWLGAFWVSYWMPH
jgi:hypothetical protein